MKKNILVIWLWWQGQKILKYFLSNKLSYNVVWCCRSVKTKDKIIEKYWIDVFLNYKEISKEKFDLIFSTVFPTKTQYEIVKYILEKTNNKVLIDLPITFNLVDLEYLLSFKKLFLFNIEHYTKIFKFIEKNKKNIKKVNAILFINKKNLNEQANARKALIVDKFYMLNNLLSLDYNNINITYKEKKIKIKDIEFIFEILIDWRKIFYKYEDSKWIIINDWTIIVDNLKYTNILDNLLENIFNSNFININDIYKKKHLEFWSNFIN